MNYLSTEEILYIHNRIVDEMGGKHGMENPKTLKKAVKYIHNNDVFPDIGSKAAALLFAIGRKKPFSDLNKKTAIAVAYLFLENNQKKLDLSQENIIKFFQDYFEKAKLEEIRGFINISI